MQDVEQRQADAPDHSAKQALALSGVELRHVPLMNASELRLFQIVRETCAQIDPELLVFAQISMGEIINTVSDTSHDKGAERAAFRAFNSKRIDLGVFSRDSIPRLAIEFNGPGHGRGNSAGRDAVKSLALEKAGVPLLVVTPEDAGDEIRQSLRQRLGQRPGG